MLIATGPLAEGGQFWLTITQPPNNLDLRFTVNYTWSWGVPLSRIGNLKKIGHVDAEWYSIEVSCYDLVYSLLNVYTSFICVQNVQPEPFCKSRFHPPVPTVIVEKQEGLMKQGCKMKWVAYVLCLHACTQIRCRIANKARQIWLNLSEVNQPLQSVIQFQKITIFQEQLTTS